MSPAALSLLTTTFTHGRDRVRALGAYGAVSAGGGALGVILGGLLTSGPGWRWVLFVNVPAAAAILAVTPLLIRGERGSGTRAGLDGRAALLVTAGLTVLTYALIRAATIGWAAPATTAGLLGAAALLLAFVLNEARAAAPLMPLRIFTVPGLAAANGVVLLAFGAVFSVFFFLSLYMQEVLGYSATTTGLAFLPLPLGIMVVADATARIIERAGTKPPMVTGSAILAGGLLLLGRLPARGSYLAGILPAILIVAAGGGMALIATVNAANHGVAPSEAGLAAALLNTSQRLGGALALAALSAVATARSRALAAADAGPAHVLTAGFDRAFLVGAALALAASLLALTIPAPAGAAGDDRTHRRLPVGARPDLRRRVRHPPAARRLPAGLATAIGAGVSMAFSEGLSDTGDLTGRGSPYLRGAITGSGTFLGGVLHTLPFLIPHYRAAVLLALAAMAFAADLARLVLRRA
jgi:MFS family permease